MLFTRQKQEKYSNDVYISMDNVRYIVIHWIMYICTVTTLNVLAVSV